MEQAAEEGSGEEDFMTFDYTEFDAEDEFPSTRSLCSEKFDKNFKIGKFAVKCTWTLVYTDTELNLEKSKANCKAGKTLKGKKYPHKDTLWVNNHNEPGH